MKSVLIVLYFLVAFTNYSFSQKVDTVYLDKTWKKLTQENYKYLRIAHQDSDLVSFTDYSKSGSIIGTGQFKTFDYKDKIGPFYYLKKNKVFQLELFEPNSYPEILSKYKDFLSSIPPQPDSLNLMVVFHKNGMVHSLGYFDFAENFYGTWSHFSKDGNLMYQHDFIKSILDGPTKYYFNNKVWISGQYVDGKKDGEWNTNDIRGNLKKIEYYQNGKFIKRIRY